MNQRRPADQLLGTIVNGRYRIMQAVAAGGMGKIYRAEQMPLGRQVALKVLNTSYTSSTKDESFQKRFFLEASILSRLQHPNIVTVFDYGQIDGAEVETFFMVMEFLSGQTLAQRLHQAGVLAAQELLPIVRQIARGLREAHHHGVVHRDLKPSNVMLVRQSEGTELVKILDFGLVKVLSDDSDQVTKEGTFLGSPRYMSPEQIAHTHIDHRTDIYSLGVIMYQALCGVPPFESDHAVQTLMGHLNNPVPPMQERNPDVVVPTALEAFVRRCLSKQPHDRPESMDAFLAELLMCERALGLVTSSADRYDVDTGSISGASQAVVRSIVDVPTRVDAPTAASRPKRRWIGAVAAAAGLVAIASVLVAVRGVGPGSAEPASSVPAQPSAEPTSTAPRSFVMWIDSTPAGAEVVEDGQVLGATPMQLSIQNEAVKRQPRRLTLRRQGYQPYSILQGPSDENVRVAAALIAEAPDVSQPVHVPNAGAGKGTTAPPKPTTTPSRPPDSDIRMER